VNPRDHRPGPHGLAMVRRTAADLRSGRQADDYNFARSVAAGPDGQVPRRLVRRPERNFAGVHQTLARRRRPPGSRTSGSRQAESAGEHPAIARSGRQVYVAWHDLLPAGPDVALRRSLDGGTTWGPEIRLGTGGLPAVAAFGASVRVVWSDDREGQAEVYTRGSADFATTWDEEERISEVPYESWVPTVELAGERAFIGWVDYADANEEEYVRRSTDAGATWEPRQRLTDDPADSWAPSLAIAGSTVHVTWFDRRDAGRHGPRRRDQARRGPDPGGQTPPPPPPRDPAVYYLPGFMARVTAKLAAIQSAAPAWVHGGGDPAQLEALLHQFQDLMTTGPSLGRSTTSARPTAEVTWGPDVRLTHAPGRLAAPFDRGVRPGDRDRLVRRPGRLGPGL